MDNRAAKVNLAWDANQVAADLATGVDLSLMFYDDALVIDGRKVLELCESLSPAVNEQTFTPLQDFEYKRY